MGNLLKGNFVKWSILFVASALLSFLLYSTIPRASLEVKDQPKGAFIKIDKASLAKPGFVVVVAQNGELGYGDFLGSSEYLLPGVYKDFNIQIAEGDLTADTVNVLIHHDDGTGYIDEVVGRHVAIGPLGKVVKEVVNLQ